MTDAAGRTITREHPEHILLARLEQCESLREVLEFCAWVLSEIGYKNLARAIERRLEEAIEEAEVEQTTPKAVERLGFPLVGPEEDHERPI